MFRLGLFLIPFIAFTISGARRVLGDAPDAQGALIQAIEKAGGTVEINKAARGAQLEVTFLQPGTNNEAMRLVGKLRGVRLVACVEPNDIDDIGLKELGRLAELEDLRLPGARISDAGLRELKGLRKLLVLDVCQTKVTEKEIVPHIHLQELEVQRTPFDDRAVSAITGLKDLEFLNLGLTKVTDACLRDIVKLKKLRGLSLAVTQVTDAGLAELPGLTDLEQLNLRFTKVTDAGMAHLKRCTRLKKLLLTNTGITDAGLLQLKELENLEVLEVNVTKVTGAGVTELRRLLPNTRILTYDRRIDPEGDP